MEKGDKVIFYDYNCLLQAGIITQVLKTKVHIKVYHSWAVEASVEKERVIGKLISY